MMTPTQQPLRFGISLPNRAVLFGVSPQALLETAEQAEASGLFDSVWVGDNFLSKPRLEAIVTLSAIAARTNWQMDAVDPALFRQRWARVQEYAAEYGRAGQVADAQMHLMVNINDDAGQAFQDSVQFLDHYYGQVYTADDLKNWLAFGSPAAVAEKINTFVEAGFTTPVLRFTSLDQRGQLERCVSEVLPQFRGRAAFA